MACNDYAGFLYRSGVIVIAPLVTGATCNDPTGDCPKVNFSRRSFSESGQGSRVTPTYHNFFGP